MVLELGSFGSIQDDFELAGRKVVARGPDDLYRPLAVAVPWAEPHHHLQSYFVYFSHLRDLSALFIVVALVNIQKVEPYLGRLLSGLGRVMYECGQGEVEVLGDADDIFANG